VNELELMLDKLPKDKEIVAYCRDLYCVLSHEAVSKLRAFAYHVRRFKDGYPEWKATGLNLVSVINKLIERILMTK